MHRVGLSLFAAASVLAAGPVFAQAPQVEKNVSMAMSLAIIQGVLEQCTKDGFKVSVVVTRENENFSRASRNVGEWKVVDPLGMNVYDVMNHGTLVLSRTALSKVVATLGGE